MQEIVLSDDQQGLATQALWAEYRKSSDVLANCPDGELDASYKKRADLKRRFEACAWAFPVTQKPLRVTFEQIVEATPEDRRILAHQAACLPCDLPHTNHSPNEIYVAAMNLVFSQDERAACRQWTSSLLTKDSCPVRRHQAFLMGYLFTKAGIAASPELIQKAASSLGSPLTNAP